MGRESTLAGKMDTCLRRYDTFAGCKISANIVLISNGEFLANKRAIKKVTAFITRVLAEEVDLLLFKHPDAGIQLPAGTVEIGEHPNEAVLREASEETGLSSFKFIKLLGRQEYFLPESEMSTLRMTKLFDEPSYDSSSSGFALTRGSTVRVQNKVGDFSRVVTDPLIFGEQSDTRINNIEGYVRTSLLTDRIERYFFHLLSSDDRKEQWDVKADGFIFRCFWAPLKTQIEINKWQRSWLREYHEEIIRSSRLNYKSKPGIE